MIDLLTGEIFTPKKISQKFSSPENRIKYNNQKANKLRDMRAFIDKPRNKNHTILLEITGSLNKKIVSCEFLLEKGYDFSKITHFHSLDNINHHCIYEFCLIMLYGNDFIKIQKIW